MRFIIILIFFGTPAEALCETADPLADFPDAVAIPGASPDFAGHWGGYVSGSEVPAVSYIRRVPIHRPVHLSYLLVGRSVINPKPAFSTHPGFGLAGKPRIWSPNPKEIITRFELDGTESNGEDTHSVSTFSELLVPQGLRLDETTSEYDLHSGKLLFTARDSGLLKKIDALAYKELNKKVNEDMAGRGDVEERLKEARGSQSVSPKPALTNCTFSGDKDWVSTVAYFGKIPAVKAGALVYLKGKDAYLTGPLDQLTPNGRGMPIRHYVIKSGCWAIQTAGGVSATPQTSIIAKDESMCEKMRKLAYRAAVMNYNNAVFACDTTPDIESNCRHVNENANEVNLMAGSRCVESDGSKDFVVWSIWEH